MTIFRAFLFLAACILATAALADVQVVTSKQNFMSIVKGRDLNRLGITLQVSDSGHITGRAFGKDVSGDWTWRDGYFCRSLFWGQRNLGDNCQQVAMDGADIRFTSDRGQGDFANFSLD